MHQSTLIQLDLLTEVNYKLVKFASFSINRPAQHSSAYYQKSLGDPNQVIGVRMAVTMSIQ